MRGNSQVRFLGGKRAVMPLTYPIDIDGRDEWQRLNFFGKRNGDWEIIYIFAAVKITIW